MLGLPVGVSGTGVALGQGGAAPSPAFTRDLTLPEFRQKLDEISRIMGRKFYVDPKEKGLDWTALTARYTELASLVGRFCLKTTHGRAAAPADNAGGINVARTGSIKALI